MRSEIFYTFFLSALLLITSGATAFAAPITINGTVRDDAGKPLTGVSISLKGSSIGTASNAEGAFTLSLPNDNGTLVVSYIGYATQEVPVEGRSSINVTLQTDAKALTNVVVVGYGTQRRENIIGSVGQVTSEDVANRPVTQLKNALTGQIAGVTVTNANGRPGAGGGAIRVRGVGSFGATPDALIIIDGIAGGNFNNIDPNDVESISVLKDASSAAIYGARAANGVILVTTKSGNRSGKATVSYNGYYGTQRPTALPEFVNSWEYALAFREANGSGASDAEIEKYKNGSDPDRYPNTDFIRAVLGRNGKQTGHNLSISGGSANNQYNISLGTLFQEGVVVNNDFSRYNARINMRTILSPKFEITTRLSIIKTLTNEPMAPVNTNQSGIFSIIDQAARVPNTYPARLSNGDFGGGINSAGTPVSYLESKSFLKQTDLNLNGLIRFDYKPVKDLKLSFISSYVQGNGHNITFRSTQRLNAITFLSPNNLTEAANESNYYTLQGLAEYTKKINKHQVNLLLGYSFEENKSSNFNGFRDNLPGDDLTVLN
nr:SusC/RagA family TonB-linked outer membrane protein [Segetibacter sp.]